MRDAYFKTTMVSSRSATNPHKLAPELRHGEEVAVYSTVLLEARN